MKRSSRRWLRRLPSALTRTLGSLLLLAMPVGYYADNPDSTDLYVGVQGGTGQLVSVLRDCAGNPISSQTNTFHDYGGEAYLPVATDSKFTFVVGVRGGYFDTETRVATYSPSYPSPRVGIGYINPNISMEWQKVGIGIGPVVGDVPASLEDLVHDRRNHLPVSYHLRIGSMEEAYFMFNVMESVPLLSGGSWFDVGVGYRASRYFDGFTGLSAGLYDRVGMLQQGRIRLARNLDLDISLRAGQTEGRFEGSVAGGLRVAFGRR